MHTIDIMVKTNTITTKNKVKANVNVTIIDYNKLWAFSEDICVCILFTVVTLMVNGTK